MNKRPITDLDDLVHAATDQAVDERIAPAVERLEKATRALEGITPLLININKRQNTQMLWLVGLTAAVIVIGLVLFSHLQYR